MLEGLKAEILACEKKVWDAMIAGDAHVDAAALSDGFLGIYPDGYSGKSDHVAQLSNGPTIIGYELSDIRILPLGDSHASLTYCADFLATGSDETKRMYVTSIWQRDSDGWINILSQDTPAGGPAGIDWV